MRGGGATVLHNSVLHELWWCVSIREGKNAFNFTINIDWVVCPWLDSFLNYRILCNYNLSYSYTAHLMNEKHICYVCVIWYWNCIYNSEGKKITNLISASMSLLFNLQWNIWYLDFVFMCNNNFLLKICRSFLHIRNDFFHLFNWFQLFSKMLQDTVRTGKKWPFWKVV
jgi:hypothetical protein